ncbi:MAG: hypothetical protein K2M87_06245 [Muribaculaceae bacterium]|nr:hypothetical protein [Muribaculaceae bacterium]
MKPETINRGLQAAAITGLVALCISPKITNGPYSRNDLLIILLVLSPLCLLFRRCRVIMPRIDLPLAVMAACVICFPAIFHPETIRWGTMLYTVGWCVGFAMLARLITASNLNGPDLIKVICWIIYAYFILLVIQQVAVLFDLPVVPMYDPRKWHVTGIKPWKLNSLHVETSLMTFTLSVLMFYRSLILRSDKSGISFAEDIKRNWKVWCAYLWVMLTTYSLGGIIFLILAFLPRINRKGLIALVGVAALLYIAGWFAPENMHNPLQRFNTLTQAVLSGDKDAIANADSSLSDRLLPNVSGFKAMFTPSADLIIGHGVDSDARDLPPRPFCKTGFAGFFTLGYMYGLICIIAFWTVLVRTSFSRRYPVTIFMTLLALQVSIEFNLQNCWLIMAWGLAFRTLVLGDKTLTSSCWCINKKHLQSSAAK